VLTTEFGEIETGSMTLGELSALVLVG